MHKKNVFEKMFTMIAMSTDVRKTEWGKKSNEATQIKKKKIEK